jgi:hypothetical protein
MWCLFKITSDGPFKKIGFIFWLEKASRVSVSKENQTKN